MPAPIPREVEAIGEVCAITDELIHSTLAERLANQAIEQGRADTLPTGAIVLRTLAEQLGIAAYTACDWGLREGVLLHSLENEPLPAKLGGPFRLLIPEDASEEAVSCANVKGVAKIVVREA